MSCALHVKRDFRTVSEYMVRHSGLSMHRFLHGSDPPVMKPCSHVTCKTCTDTLVRPANQCVVCDKLLAEGDILELKREGGSFLLT
jgi:zinc-RING finger domain